MTGIWLISYIGLWILTMLLCLTVVVLARQIGILHQRMPPLGARMTNTGLNVGDAAPSLLARDIHGQQVIVGGEQGKPTLLVFASATCGICADLMTAVRTIWQEEQSWLNVIVVSLDKDEAENREFATKHKLFDLTFLVAPQLGLAYSVATPPYSLIVDEQGIVRSKGVTNNLEHLESLVNALRTGHPSRESWMQTQPIGHTQVKHLERSQGAN
jgi:methylamine dehydrogenase accessory protein MauD